ncbi:MAG: DegT/DnrJ/EryC1/StrS family aminotransferase [Candidatus Hermodarchaeota archaeon]
MISIAKPLLDEEELERIKEVLASGMLVESKNNKILEEEFAEFTRTKHAISTSNGTTALHLALESLGIAPGDEIITSPFTFIASANSICFVGAIPIFADIDPFTFNLDPETVKPLITKKTKAIMPIHIFGLPADMKVFRDLADDHDLFLIEDACQAHGAQIDGQPVGSFGDVASFSFYATKNMIAGEGGMVTTNNEELADLCRSLKNHGREAGKSGGYMHYRIGYNMRIAEINAAIALVQLRKLPQFLKQRAKNADIYRKLLGENEAFRLQQVPSGFTHANYIFALCLEETYANKSVSEVLNDLKSNNIGCRPIYDIPVHKQPTYRNIKQWRWAKVGIPYPDYQKLSFPNTEYVAKNHFEIPVNPAVSEKDATFVAEKILTLFK